MSTTVLQVRLDSQLKKDADSLFSSAGFDTTTAVRIFLKQSVIRHRLPFDVVGEEENLAPQDEKDDPFYSEENQAAIKRAIDDYNAGKNFSVHELIEDYDA
jgi:DNA-damage-inducible protein J